VAGIALAGMAAAHLGELSQSTGVSVESLSLLGDVAEAKGISVDQMGKALEKLSKSAVAAAQAGPKASNAYKDLGIAVTNADGTMRSAEDIFNSVSAKFATMPDGPLKTAEAMMKLEGDEQIGANIVKRALQEPLRQIAENAGEEGAIVLGKVNDSHDNNFGYNALTGDYEDLVKAGVLDPTKVVRTVCRANFSRRNSATACGCFMSCCGWCSFRRGAADLRPADRSKGRLLHRRDRSLRGQVHFLWRELDACVLAQEERARAVRGWRKTANGNAAN
jgi:hypothetical protein